ncbi:MAG: bifunctional metallophosphatase/5'-nucleotidase [Actinobacteria bacterium]|nr:bifunctional metallophosphatase/5'-nucleotidase [Actinomycetota bacterium]
MTGPTHDALHSDAWSAARRLARTGLTRRNMLRAAGTAGVALGAGAAAALPAAAAESGSAAAMARSEAVRRGRATHLTILQTADIHGQLETHDEFFWENGAPAYRRTGGMARIKTLVDRARAENEDGTLLIDGGDCIQGSGWVALSRGGVIPPIMRAMEYDMVAPGNWEVVYGKQRLVEVISDYDAPVISSNMFHDVNGQPGGYLFTPAYVKVVGGVRIGFVGFNDPAVPTRQSPAYSVGIKFTTPDVNAQQWITWLREDQQCDLVFALTHMGITRQVDLASADYMVGVDYILGADTHERIRTPIHGTHSAVTEPGAFGSFVGRLDLVVENGVVKEQDYALVEVAEKDFRENRKVRRTVAQVTAPYRAELSQVIGTTRTPLLRYYVLETPMDNLITDAVHEVASGLLAKQGVTLDVALSNGFRFCPPLAPPAGGTAPITREFLYSMLPIDSNLKVATVPGSLLRPWMEKELNNVFATDPNQVFGGWVVRMSGMSVRFTLGRPYGQRVDSISIGGTPLDETRSYVFSACDRDGDPPTVLCRLKGVLNPMVLPITLHQAIETYLAAHSPVAPRVEGRVSASDLPQLLLGQLTGTGYQFR